jgi:hypothetical protein
VRLVSKLYLAVIAAAIVCGAMWVERSHHISIDAPTPAEIAFQIAVAACPDNDSMPYTASCLAFMQSSPAPSRGGGRSLTESAASLDPSMHSISECPDNDNKPYPPDCVRFLSGWFWQPH